MKQDDHQPERSAVCIEEARNVEGNALRQTSKDHKSEIKHYNCATGQRSIGQECSEMNINLENMFDLDGVT